MSIKIAVKFASPLKYLLIITSSGILCPSSATLAATLSIASLTSFNQKNKSVIL